MTARMQPAMPRYARGEKAPSAGWAADAPARHTSVSVFAPGPSFSNPPAAMQVDGAGQAAVKLLTSPSPGRTGVGWICQLRPFHRSARVPKNAFPKLSVSSPAAVQDEADVHATVLKRLPGDPVLGVGWMVHFVPFHRIAAPRSATAVQATVDVQVTPPRPPPCGGLGVRWMAQLLPFHRSARVATGFPALSRRKPAATQNEADVHATPVKPLPADPGGLGVAWIVQSSPFHRSASVPAFDAPTATQSVSEAQDTAFRLAPGRVGMRCRCQVRPFHRRASVDTTPRVGPTVPTAAHASVAGQAIPFSWLSAAPTGLGTA